MSQAPNKKSALNIASIMLNSHALRDRLRNSLRSDKAHATGVWKRDALLTTFDKRERLKKIGEK